MLSEANKTWNTNGTNMELLWNFDVPFKFDVCSMSKWSNRNGNEHKQHCSTYRKMAP